SEGEIALWVVDKSILDLKPTPPPSFFSVLFNEYFSASNIYRTITSEDVYKKTFEIIMRRIKHNGWLRDLQWEFNSNWGSPSYDTPDEEFHKNKYTVLTEKPQVYVMGRYPEG